MRTIVMGVLAFGFCNHAFGATLEMNGNELGEMFGTAVACNLNNRLPMIVNMIEQWLDENGRDVKLQIIVVSTRKENELETMGATKLRAYCEKLK